MFGASWFGQRLIQRAFQICRIKLLHIPSSERGLNITHLMEDGAGVELSCSQIQCFKRKSFTFSLWHFPQRMFPLRIATQHVFYQFSWLSSHQSVKLEMTSLNSSLLPSDTGPVVAASSENLWCQGEEKRGREEFPGESLCCRIKHHSHSHKSEQEGVQLSACQGCRHPLWSLRLNHSDFFCR